MTATATEPLPASNRTELPPDFGRTAPKRRPARRPATSRQLIAFGLLLVAAILIATGWKIVASREEALRDGERALANLDHALAEHTDSTVRGIDLVLRGTAEWAEGLSDVERSDPERLYQLLRTRLAAFPMIRVLGIYRPDGHVWLNTRSSPPPRFYRYAAPFFIAHRDHPDSGLYIGLPRRALGDGRWTLFFSRALRGPDRRFDGVVVALVDPVYFQEAYRRLDLGENRSITLMRGDGYLLTSYPWQDTMAGKDLRDQPLFREVRSRADHGVVRDAGPGHAPRLLSVQHLRDYPLAVSVAVGQARALRQWRRSAQALAAGAAVGCTITMLLILVLSRQVRVQETISSQLRVSEERLRLVNEVTQDGIWDWDLRSGAAWFSERYYTMLGYDPGAFEAGYARWRSLVHPDDLAGAEAVVRSHLHRGDSPYDIEFRLRTRDGDWRWINGRGRVVEWERDGKPARLVGIHKDITERKQREAEIAQRTEELTRFAYTVSHDLKSPLVTIQTFLRFLERDMRSRDAERIAKDIDFMRNAADKMTRLLNELLELSRIGRRSNPTVAVTLGELAREAMALVKRIVEVHGGNIWIESAGPGQGAEVRFTLAGARWPARRSQQ